MINNFFFFLNKVGCSSGPWGGGGGYTEMLCPKIHMYMCVPKGISLWSVINQVIEENAEDGEVGTSRLDVIVPDINK